MKRTRITFLLAATLYTLALSFPRRELAREVTVPLPGNDIAEIDVQGAENGNAKVQVCRSTRPFARYTRSDRNRLSIERRGARLIANFATDGYGSELTLCVPPSVRVFSGMIDQVDVGESSDAMELRISQRVTWRGAVGELRVVDIATQEPGCRIGNQGVEIDKDARIANLVVSTWNGYVTLDNPAHIGEAHLRFGPRARLTLGNAISSHDLHYEPYDRPAPEPCPESDNDSLACPAP